MTLEKVPFRVALYARVSTVDQTVNQQMVPLHQECAKLGWEFDGFIDYASGAKESRPELDLMMQAIRRDEYQAVMVLRLDRLGRSLQHLLQLIEEFRNKKVRFISLSQGFDTETAQGRFFLQVIGAVAEFERELIRERINDKLKVIKAQEKITGIKRLGRPKGAKDGHQRRRSGYWQRWAGKKVDAKKRGVPSSMGAAKKSEVNNQVII